MLTLYQQRVNFSDYFLPVADTGEVLDFTDSMLTTYFSLESSGDALKEPERLFYYNNYHHVNKFRFETKDSIADTLAATVTQYDKMIATFTGGDGDKFDTNVEVLESYFTSIYKMASTKAPISSTWICDEYPDITDLQGAEEQLKIEEDGTVLYLTEGDYAELLDVINSVAPNQIPSIDKRSFVSRWFFVCPKVLDLSHFRALCFSPCSNSWCFRVAVFGGYLTRTCGC